MGSTEPKHSRNQNNTTEMIAAVSLAAGEFETEPSPQLYEWWRDDSLPVATTIIDQCGSWPTDLRQAGLVSWILSNRGVQALHGP